MRERTLWRAIEVMLLLACASFWFGNTGLGLTLLWLGCPGRLGIESALPPSLAGMKPVWVGQRRVRLGGEDGLRVDVYRDEMSPSEWASLKRQCLHAQLATGRSTSIWSP